MRNHEATKLKNDRLLIETARSALERFEAYTEGRRAAPLPRSEDTKGGKINESVVFNESKLLERSKKGQKKDRSASRTHDHSEKEIRAVHLGGRDLL